MIVVKWEKCLTVEDMSNVYYWLLRVVRWVDVAAAGGLMCQICLMANVVGSRPMGNMFDSRCC